MSQENLQQQIEQVIEKMKEIPERIEKLKRLVISGQQLRGADKKFFVKQKTYFFIY